MSAEKTVKELLEKFESLEENEPVVFSGSTTMLKELFLLFYVVLLNKVIEKRGKIRVGCAKGCDEMIQQHCIDNNYFNVEVYIPSEDKSPLILSEKFQKIVVEGKFKKRDRAMQVGCKPANFVGFFSQYAGAASGTAANAISMEAKNGAFGEDFKELDGYAVVDVLRKHGYSFDDSLAKHVQQFEAEFESKKKNK